MNISNVWQTYVKGVSKLAVSYSDLDPLNVRQSLDDDNKALWVIGWLCLLEYVILWIRSKPLPPGHENLMSMTHACFCHLIRIGLRSFQYSAYVWVWSYGLFPDWFSDSPWSFLFSVVLIDFGYYWFHKASHEVTVLWAVHQVHHSSQDITVSVGLRHSPLQNLYVWAFYLPFALIGLPPSHFVFHIQFNLLYQTWLHTSAVEKLGVLEYVFNTPSHHRIHHGSINHCIDVNYGGVFIFWDYLFGTFHAEKKNEVIVYGIIFQPEYWNMLQHQVFYLQYAWEKAKSMGNWKHFFTTFFYGPSWIPGSSRTGRELYEKISGPTERIKVNTSFLLNCYVTLHLIASFVHCAELDQLTGSRGISFALLLYASFILASLSNFGFLYDGKSFAAKVELCRCISGLVFSMYCSQSGVTGLYLVLLYLTSLSIWLLPSRVHKSSLGLNDSINQSRVDDMSILRQSSLKEE